MILVELERYGDFDMPYTAAVLIAPDWMSKKGVKEIVKEIEAENSTERTAEKAIKKFKSLEFKVCSTMSCTVGGGL